MGRSENPIGRGPVATPEGDGEDLRGGTGPQSTPSDR